MKPTRRPRVFLHAASPPFLSAKPPLLRCGVETSAADPHHHHHNTTSSWSQRQRRTGLRGGGGGGADAVWHERVGAPDRAQDVGGGWLAGWLVGWGATAASAAATRAELQARYQAAGCRASIARDADGAYRGASPACLAGAPNTRTHTHTRAPLHPSTSTLRPSHQPLPAPLLG